MELVKIITIPLLYFSASLFFHHKSKEKFCEANYLVVLLGIKNEKQWRKYNRTISRNSLKIGLILLSTTILVGSLIDLKKFTNILISIQILPYFLLAYLSIKNVDD